MGTWQKELDRVLAQSEKNKKIIDESLAYFQKVGSAAQAFIGAHAKAAPQFQNALSSLMDLAEKCGRVAADLMVLEDELDAAESAGDKAAAKKFEGKMKPLIASFEATMKEGLKVASDHNKADAELQKTADAVAGAIGC
jgi:hypothetical protein